MPVQAVVLILSLPRVDAKSMCAWKSVLVVGPPEVVTADIRVVGPPQVVTADIQECDVFLTAVTH